MSCTGAPDKVGALRINLRYVFLNLNENLCCDPSLELSRRDSSNEGSQHSFLMEKSGNYP